MAEQVAATDSTVLLMGETGTGRNDLPPISTSAAGGKKRLIIGPTVSYSASLIESELFGREKGAYTGALSKQIGRFEFGHESTLFLDEIWRTPDRDAGEVASCSVEPHDRTARQPQAESPWMYASSQQRTATLPQQSAKGGSASASRAPDIFPILIHRSVNVERTSRFSLTRIDELSGKMGKWIQKSDRAGFREETLMRYAWPGTF